MTAPDHPHARTGPATEHSWNLVFAAWLVAAAATLGALFFSEVMRVPPCVLCWYQRIFMFPLLILLPLGLFPFDPRIVRYALPLATLGGMVALFHVLLTWGVVSESITPCSQGVPCGSNQFELFGFISIPLLALLAFLVIVALLVKAHRSLSK
jgi:disulfide bond formation protein DsbB